MDKRIRQITETIFNREPFVYYVNQERRLPIGGKSQLRTICDIAETENHYILYIANGEISQEWKKIPKSDRITIEYFID